jgi:hypothetical protein
MENTECHPDWLNEAFMEKALSISRKDSLPTVSGFSAKPSLVGNFASSLFHCTMTITTQSDSKLEASYMMIKIEPVNEGLKRDIASEGPLFETEIKMYNEVIPIMTQLFKSKGLNVDFAPE